MADFSYDPTSINGDDARGVKASTMRVGPAGELVFGHFRGTIEDYAVVPTLIIAPGEWKAAWTND